MNIVTVLLLVVAAIVIIILVAALAGKKEYQVHRSIEIDAPAARVFQYVRHLKNQDYYNKWVMTDPQMKKEFKGTDGTVGFIYGWSGNKKAGEGEQEILSIKEDSEVVSEARFVRPFPGLSRLRMVTTPINLQQTKVDFITSSRMPFPMNAMVPMVSKMLGRDMDISLRNLKAILER